MITQLLIIFYIWIITLLVLSSIVLSIVTFIIVKTRFVEYVKRNDNR